MQQQKRPIRDAFDTNVIGRNVFFNLSFFEIFTIPFVFYPIEVYRADNKNLVRI